MNNKRIFKAIAICKTMSKKASRQAKDLEATLSETDIAVPLNVMDKARQLIYLRNMAGVSKGLLTGAGQIIFAEGFFGVTVDWFDERAKAGDYNLLAQRLEQCAGRFPGVTNTLKDLYATFPVLNPEQPARQPAPKS